MSTRVRVTVESIHYFPDDLVVFETSGGFGGRVWWIGPESDDDVDLDYRIPAHDRLDEAQA